MRYNFKRHRNHNVKLFNFFLLLIYSSINLASLNSNDLVLREAIAFCEFWDVFIELRRSTNVNSLRHILTQYILNKLLSQPSIQTLNIKVLVAIAELEKRLESRIFHL